MELAHHITAIQSDLAAAAALGGEETADAGRRLSDALGSSLQLRLLDVLTEAGLELNAALPDGHVEVRLAGRDPELVYVPEVAATEETVLLGEELGARITLRLPEALKAAVEAAAGREGVSTNTWIVRALRRGLDPRPRSRTGNRIQGFARS
jgi:HicB-like protein involved in pilus formation